MIPLNYIRYDNMKRNIFDLFLDFIDKFFHSSQPINTYDC